MWSQAKRWQRGADFFFLGMQSFLLAVHIRAVDATSTSGTSRSRATFAPWSALTAQEREARKELKRKAASRRRQEREETRQRNTCGQPLRPEYLLDQPRRSMLNEASQFLSKLLHHEGYASHRDIAMSDADLLLRNMSLGTQELEMFSSAACWGYVKRKFVPRAVLVFDHLRALERVDAELWQALTRCARCCVSIGGGPGNDAYGLYLLFRHVFGEARSCQLTVLDMASVQWRETFDCVRDQLLSSVAKTFDSQARLGEAEEQELTLELHPCDVCQPLEAACNSAAAAVAPSADLFLISYVLTETRGAWLGFVTSLWRAAKIGALFYFAEPTPWQLHLLIREFAWTVNRDVYWVDDTLGQTASEQALMMRHGGPGIMVAVKRR